MMKFMKPGISMAALILLGALLIFQARAVDQFKSTAMRFVAAEAISFVAIPNLKDFFDNGTHSLLEIAKAVVGKDKDPDLLTLLMPSPVLASETLPTQCRTLRTSADLAKNGIVADSSFSIALLDSGFKSAVKLREDGPGMVFLSDLLFPAYIRIGYDPEFDIKPKPPAKEEAAEATDSEGSQISKTPDSYKFSFGIKSSGLDFCPRPEWARKDDAASSIVVEGHGEHLYLPMRFSDSMSSPTAAPQKFEVTCEVSKNSEAPRPCRCDFLELAIGDANADHARQSGCSQDEALKRRKDDIAKWTQSLRGGDTVSIGDQYLAIIDNFHVIEDVSLGGKRPAAYRVSRPIVSIVSDDTLLSQFQRILREGKDFRATVFAGARPDMIDALAKIAALPMYLLTPIGIHLSDNEIRVDTLSNLEPQDMAIVQTIAAANKQESNLQSWTDWRKALGGQLSDNSLKLYAKFIRSYFPNVDASLAKYSPLAQIAIDIMEQGAGAVVLSVREFYSDDHDGHVARLAIAVPDIGNENAGSLVTESRRQSIMRQARFTADKASALALQRGAQPKELMQATMALYCVSSLWQLKSVEVRPSHEKDMPPKAHPLVEIDEASFLSQTNWSVSENGFDFQRILPFEDANAMVWGNAYLNTQGLAEKDGDEVKLTAADFVDHVEELRSTLSDDPDAYGKILKSMVPVLTEKAVYLQSKRSFVRENDMVSQTKQLLDATGPDDAVARVNALKEKFSKAEDIALLGPADIADLCQKDERKLAESPLAFYDRRVKTLYVVDSSTLMLTLKGGSPTGHDTEGKLLVGFEMQNLAELLMGNKIIEADAAKKMTDFPFSKIELSLAGRQTGTGISAKLLLKKAGEK